MLIAFAYGCVVLAILFFIAGLVKDYRQAQGFWSHRAPEKLWEVVSIENLDEFTAKVTLRHPESKLVRLVMVPRKLLIEPSSR